MSDHDPHDGEDRGFSPPGADPSTPPPAPEQPPALGWWKASDGNWYPPQDQAPPPPPGPTQAFGNQWAPPPVGQAPAGPPSGPPTAPPQADPPPAEPGGGQQWAPPPPGAGYGQSAAPGGGVYYAPYQTAQRTNGLATWSLVLGIISILAFWAFGFGILLGILALIFGVMGRNRAREQPGTPHEGRARAGIVLGAIGIVGGTLFIGWALTFVDDVVDEIENQSDDGICEPDNPFDPDC